MNPAELKAIGLQHGFNRQILWQIDQLQLQAGQCVHLRGENGSGKTTLLKVLAGLQRPRAGRVLINDQSVRLGDGRCCYLHQQPYMFDKSVRANLAQVLASGPGSKIERSERIEQALHWSGLSHHAGQAARTLSDNERQALAMARAWLCQPLFWLLDEPIASLDEKGMERCVELVTQLRHSGAAILMTSHQQGALTALCDSQWQLHQGKLITEGG
jgi:tungstate transport system ATP-binding protein